MAFYRDIRYSANGNMVRARRDVTSGMDAMQVLDHLRDYISSATYRMDPELEGQDFYSPALDGRGIVLRSVWQVGPLLAAGALVPVLPGWTQPASVWAVYPQRLERSARLRVAVEFLQRWFAQGPRPEA